MTDDDQLMIRIQSGDTAAFDELVDIHQGPLIGFFFRNTRDAQLSEDLTQETLLKVYNQAWDFLPVGRFRGWMYRIGRNLLIDNVRRRTNDALVRAYKGRVNDEHDGLARLVGDVVSPENKADQRELARLVDNLLEEIPEEQRLTFTLYHYSGLSLPEVAQVMDTSVPTSKSRLRLAREKLREKLARKGITAEHAHDSINASSAVTIDLT
jgi:RNA polymerase sigma-70 factor (ECF subfamily)